MFFIPVSRAIWPQLLFECWKVVENANTIYYKYIHENPRSKEHFKLSRVSIFHHFCYFSSSCYSLYHLSKKNTYILYVNIKITPKTCSIRRKLIFVLVSPKMIDLLFELLIRGTFLIWFLSLLFGFCLLSMYMPLNMHFLKQTEDKMCNKWKKMKCVAICNNITAPSHANVNVKV